MGRGKLRPIWHDLDCNAKQFMPSKLTEAILKRIRLRAADPSLRGVATESLHATAGPVAIREAQFSDFDQVSAMNHRLGQGADSRENWLRLWRDNPALREGRIPRIGWVLEAAGQVVGFLGNIPLLCEFENKTLAAAATCRLAVEPAYRSSTPLLVTSFFRQKDVDLFLNTTATVAAGKIMTALRAVPLPQPDYGNVLFWVLRPRKFMNTVLGKAGFAGALAGAGSAIAAIALRGEMAIRRRTPKANLKQYSIVETAVNEIGPEFAPFCALATANSPRLFSKRSPEIMRWHFSPPGSSRVARMLACFDSGRLLGYAVVRHESSPKNDVHRSLIADLMVHPQNDFVIDTLLAAAHASARNADSEVLEVLGFPKHIRERLQKWRPYSRNYPANPYFFKARDNALQERLAIQDAWYACPFDGDATLWP
jgi:hypothetical protein